MEKLYKIIVENTTNGGIEKKVAVELLKTIKRGDIRAKDDIAIIGVAVRFPMAENSNDFWTNIASKTDCISKIPEDRLTDLLGYFRHKKIDTRNIEFIEQGYINNINKFDYHYFNISPKEASLMDPYQRVFLETAMEAIEDGGYGGNRLKGSRTGVYVGSSSDFERIDYLSLVMGTEPSKFSIAAPGNIKSIVAGRVSYLFDLKGPAVVFNTACSSSLVALYYACQGLQNGECNMAIAGGIKIMYSPTKEKGKVGVESSTYRARTFDNNSDGTSVGEGSGVVLLKPLKKAIADGDNIYAVIKGLAINQDGSSNGMTAPKPEAQEEVIIRAWKDAGIDPRTIQYIEAHGTATKLGDPIEIDGIQRAFRKFTSDRQFCAISAVKTNIGHLDAAAGIAGLVKAVLALKNKKLPPTNNFNLPNRVIDFKNSPVYVNDKLREWRREATPRRCGVSSFGMSGTNCHVVLEEALDTDIVSVNNHGLQIFTISAKTQESLNIMLQRYVEFLDNAVMPSATSFCYTSNIGRGHYGYRIIVILDKDEDIREKIKGVHTKSTYMDAERGIFFGINNGANALTMAVSQQANEKVNQFVTQGKKQRDILTDICSLYVKGAYIDWDNFYKGEKIRKISIPTYPYTKKRCWVEIPRNAEDVGFFKTVWEPRALPDTKQSNRHTDILIFEDAKGLGSEIRRSYEEQGNNVISISFGEEYVKTSEDRYCIRNIQEDYTTLLNEIPLNNITQIIHLAAVSQGSKVNSYDELTFELQNGVMSLFYLTKALAVHNIKNQVELVIVSNCTNGVTENEIPIHPEHSTMYGLGKVIGQENRNLSCRCIDIDEHTSHNALIQELSSFSEEYATAYREGKRYVEGFLRIDIGNKEKGSLPIKKNGVYVVTGGAGGIGLELSSYLASKGPVQLIFINRTPVPDRSQWKDLIKSRGNKWGKRLIKISGMEKNGTEVSFYSADISDYSTMKDVMEDIISKYEGINGIIHCAGLAGDGFILKKDEDVFKSVLSPKVYGAWVLDDLTKDQELDFMIYCSSIASVFGGAGQGDYAAANSYLDAFSTSRNRNCKKTISICWPAWEEVGMYAESTSRMKPIIQPLSIANAIDIFDKIAGTNLPKVVVGDTNSTALPLNSFIDTGKLLSYINIDNSIGREKADMVLSEAKKPVRNVVLTGRENGYYDMERVVGRFWGDVLGMEEIHVDSDFFELGGNSLIALNLASDLNAHCKVALTVTDMFDYPTIAKLAAYISDMEKSQYIEMGKAPVKEYYNSSAAQKRLHVINYIDSLSTAYNNTSVLVIRDKISMEQIELAFSKIIDRHESLRTSFHFIDGESMQKIHDTVSFYVEYEEMESINMKELMKQFVRPFDLANAPLLRVKVVKTGEATYVLALDMHHIISDGTSMNIIVSDLARLYMGEELEPLELQYKDFSEWQTVLFESEEIQRQEAYWLNVYKESVPTISLPYDYPRPSQKSYKGNKIFYRLDKEFVNKVREVTARTGMTPFMTLIATYNILLYKYSGQEDIVVGSPIAGRTRPGLESIIGMFVNTLAIRNRPRGDCSLAEFLQEVKHNCLSAYENQDYPFDRLIEKLNIARDLSRNPLYDTMLMLQNYDRSALDTESKLFESPEMLNEVSKLDLTLEFFEKGDEMDLAIEYCTELFKKETMDQLAEDFITILNDIYTNPEKRLRDINSSSDVTVQDDNYDPDDVIIDDIEPFSDFFYKNCVFNSLFPVIKHFKRSIIPILSNDALVYTLNASGRISSKYIQFTDLLGIIKELGINGEVKVIVDDVIHSVKEAIKKERLCIVKIDCFYVSERKDTYQSLHFPHTLLVYGYNDAKQVFHVIDHRRRESPVYGKYTIPYSEFADAYSGFISNFLAEDDTGTTYYELFEERLFDEAEQLSKSIEAYRSNIVNNKERMIQGIEIFRMISQEFAVYDPAFGISTQYLEECIIGFNEIINAKQVESLKVEGLFGKEAELTGLIEEINKVWITARAKTAKLLYTESSSEKKVLEIYDLLKEIVRLEVQYHNSLYRNLTGSDLY